jgi:translation initiation factor 2A
MPAKTVLFDQRVRILYDYGSAPHNFISFNPQGRLVLLAGFGNLAGKVDVHDRRSLTKVTTIDAPNTSVCEWSPDGQFILTATLSPRLRVDNGIKIWHCSSSSLIHTLAIDEMYQTGWRPLPSAQVPPFPQGIPAAPAPSLSATAALANGKAATPSKPAGAYRPPGARGLATPSIFKREDEGGIAHVQNGVAGSPSPARTYSPRTVPGAPTPGQNGHQRGPRQRHVPGAPSSSHSPSPGPAGEARGKGKKGKKGPKEASSNPTTPQAEIEVVPVEVVAPEPVPAVSPTIDEPALDAKAKKIRNLTKKVNCLASVTFLSCSYTHFCS